MYMIGHQAIRVYVAPIPTCKRPQMRKVSKVVDVFPEAGVAVIAPLDQVQRYTREDQSRMPCHKRMKRPACAAG